MAPLKVASPPSVIYPSLGMSGGSPHGSEHGHPSGTGALSLFSG